MASLALIVSLIFVSLLIIGPLSYIISLFDWIPSIIKYLLGIACVGVGVWAIFIPVPLFRALGLVNLYIGAKVIFGVGEKATKA